MLKWFLINTISLLIITRLLPGFQIDSWVNAIIAVLIIGILNITIKPILSLLTLPINFLTLGLFSLVLNTLMLLLAAYLAPGFQINGFVTALIASLLHSIFTSAISTLTKR